VPLQFSAHLKQVMDGAQKPADYYEYPGNDHQFTRNYSVLMPRIMEFYRTHL
jgi:hypothetical protein